MVIFGFSMRVVPDVVLFVVFVCIRCSRCENLMSSQHVFEFLKVFFVKNLYVKRWFPAIFSGFQGLRKPFLHFMLDIKNLDI